MNNGLNKDSSGFMSSVIFTAVSSVKITELESVRHLCTTTAKYHGRELFCRDKSLLAATIPLPRQNYVCRNKIYLSRQNLSRQIFVVTDTCYKLLSRQKLYLWQLSPMIAKLTQPRPKVALAPLYRDTHSAKCRHGTAPLPESRHNTARETLD